MSTILAVLWHDAAPTTVRLLFCYSGERIYIYSFVSRIFILGFWNKKKKKISSLAVFSFLLEKHSGEGFFNTLVRLRTKHTGFTQKLFTFENVVTITVVCDSLSTTLNFRKYP